MERVRASHMQADGRRPTEETPPNAFAARVLTTKSSALAAPRTRPRHATPTARLRVERNAYTSTGRLPSAEGEEPLSHVCTRDKVTQSTKQTKCEATSKLSSTTTVSHTSRRTPRKKYHAAAESIRETSSNVRPLIRTELPSHMNRAKQGAQQRTNVITL